MRRPPLFSEDSRGRFRYNLEIGGAGPEQTHLLRVKLSADLPAARTPTPNESPDDKKKKDEEFNKQLEQWKTRLAEEQKLEHWIFLVIASSVRVQIMNGPRNWRAFSIHSQSPRAKPQRLITLPFCSILKL
jgi:hypothetical protein